MARADVGRAPRDRLALVDAEAHPPANRRERLLDSRVDMLAQDCPARLVVQVALQELAFGLLGAYPHHRPLSGGRVLDSVPCLGDDLPLLCVSSLGM